MEPESTNPDDMCRRKVLHILTTEHDVPTEKAEGMVAKYFDLPEVVPIKWRPGAVAWFMVMKEAEPS